MGEARNLASVIGEDELSPIDKQYLKFGEEFEKRYIGQGPKENRTILNTLDLGWELLGLLPKEELDRIDTKLVDKYYKKKEETDEEESERRQSMDPREFPTKGNLMLAKNSLALAHQGYDLMDKKRNILLKELMSLIDEAKDIQEEIDQTFTKAYACLQRANIEHGISKVRELAFTVPIEDSIRIQTRSIMGTEIPHVKYDAKQNDLTYSFSTTRESIDIAREAFREVKDLTIKLSMVENAAYRLATNIKKTQKRANALKNITIPMYSNLVYTISNALEEKEREEFTRLKVIKRMKS